MPAIGTQPQWYKDVSLMRSRASPRLSLKGGAVVAQAFVDKFRYNAKRASLVQSRIKAIERMADVELVEADPEYCFRCAPGQGLLS